MNCYWEIEDFFLFLENATIELPLLNIPNCLILKSNQPLENGQVWGWDLVQAVMVGCRHLLGS